MCLCKNSLHKAFEYWRREQKSIPDLTEICDLVKSQTNEYTLKNIKVILKINKKFKYYEYALDILANITNIPKAMSVWESDKLDMIFDIYDLWWVNADKKCINPTKIAESILIIMNDGWNALPDEKIKDKYVKDSLGALVIIQSKL